MRPKISLKASQHSRPIQHASGSSKLLKPPALRDADRSRQLAFCDESSETEYTSSSGEAAAAHENGNCVQSKPKDGPPCQTQPVQAPRENMVDLLKSQMKAENLAISSISQLKAGSFIISNQEISRRPSPPKSGLLNGQIARRPLEVKSTSMKERHEIGKDGKAIVVVDLGDSDDEIAAPLQEPSHLCNKCHALQHTQAEPQLVKAFEKKEVHTSNVKLVVDLSGTYSQVNRAPTAAGEQATLQKLEISHDVMTPGLVKSNGKQVEAEVGFSREHMKRASSRVGRKQVAAGMEFNREHMKTFSLKTSKKQVETKVDFSRVRVKTATESHLKPRSRIGLSTEVVLRASTEKAREVAISEAEESEAEGSTISGDYRKSHDEGLYAEMVPPDWSPGVFCDLCEEGPSLSLGAWYSWCCGNPSLGCACSYDDQQRKKKSLMWKSGKNWKSTDPPYPWSGKVHKLCGLWSAEVFEDSKHPWRIVKLWAAVQRSKKIKCSDPDCGLFGATLGCRVASCKKNFHYPCADRLSVLMKLRMWDGLTKPVACKDHRHINEEVNDVKLQKEGKKRKRGKKSLLAASGAGSSKLGLRTSSDANLIQIESSDEEGSLHGATAQDVICRWNSPNVLDSRVAITKSTFTPDSWPRIPASGPAYMGKNLLCADFAGGLEPIQVPCTNDVDSEPPPYLEYITKSRYQGQPLGSKNCQHPLLERKAKGCNGCALHDPDNPLAPLSVHIPFERREDDFREDWLRERMYGRLPYDKYARLVIGTDYNELVECNERCKCGDFCINREMQKGLRTPIELYKTVNKGWAVRTLVNIPRGRFVIEYVGEMLTQDQAQKYGQMYDEIKRSYLYDLDYPESKRTPDFTLDGFHASNVARFINHSCDANLKIYRVYVETTYKWLSHIGMYAMRDIEAGEELSYDYNYGRHDLHTHDGNTNKPEAGKQKIDLENDSTHIKCYCGAKNCREWLWRPMHTGEDSEDE